MMSTAERLMRLREQTLSGEARRIREESRLSIAELARSVGTDATNVGRWERGQRLPKGAPALKYAALLDRLARVDA